MITPVKSNVKQNGIADKNLTSLRQFFTKSGADRLQKVAVKNQFMFAKGSQPTGQRRSKGR
jgi:hypothetical protein